MAMNKICSYLSEPEPWRGMKIILIGCLISLPGLFVQIYFDTENRMIYRLTSILFLFGFIIALIGIVNHFRWFKKR